jgi:nicotinamide-nucleotide amidase
MDYELFELSQQLGQLLASQKKIITTAESCTGGWIAQVITEVAGSSAWYDRGFITYSNESKIKMLGVKHTTLDTYGAVSSQTVAEMADGALINSNADCAIAVTGIAGPTGGTDEKPVGTVYIAWAYKNQDIKIIQTRLTGNRNDIRREVVKIALKGIKLA